MMVLLLLILEDMEEPWGVSIDPHPGVPILVQLLPLLAEDISSSSSHLKPPMGHFGSIVYSILPIIPTITTRVELIINIIIMHHLPHLP
jgi:hypothetical protein